MGGKVGRVRLFLGLLTCALVLNLAIQGATVPSVAAATTSFCDVPSSAPYYEAVTQLSAQGIIKGYDNGCFGPNDTTLRAQMAALIARTVRWDGEDHGNSFPDKGSVDNDLWRNVGTLAYYDVARGYQDGTYQPTNEVLYAQTISFITRALVRVNYWQPQADNPAVYPNIPASSGHRADISTYVAYAGPVPNWPSTPQPWTNWNSASTRSWFAMALWQAIKPKNIPSGWLVWRGIPIPYYMVLQSERPSPNPFLSGNNLPLTCVEGRFSTGLGSGARSVLEPQFNNTWASIGLYSDGQPSLRNTNYFGRERMVVVLWGDTTTLWDCPR